MFPKNVCFMKCDKNWGTAALKCGFIAGCFRDFQKSNIFVTKVKTPPGEELFLQSVFEF